MTNETVYDVAVVGGGFAGLSAARALGELGHSCVLLEARDRLGGRTFYRRFAETDVEVEFGGTWVAPATQPHVAAEIARYGLGLIQSPEPETFHWTVDGELRVGNPFGKRERAGFERASYELLKAAERVDHARPLDSQDLDDLDVSLEDFFERLALPTGVRDFLGSWGVLYGGCPGDQNSLLHVVLDVIEYGNSITAFLDALDDQLALGTRHLAELMARDSRAEQRLSSPVSEIQQRPDGVLLTTDGRESFSARACVVALPVNVWSSVRFTPELNPGKRAVAAVGHAGHAAKVWVLARNTPPNVIALAPDTRLAWLSTERHTPDGDLLVGFGVGDDINVTDKEQVAYAVRQLCPTAEVVAVDGHDWTRDPYSRGAWAWYRPGQLTRHHGDLTASEGRLIFAGSDIAATWMSWIEGALASGARAAEDANRLLAAASHATA
ncbi:MAG TPA: NAD(P)/FAD-dependent oxidoreductase [Thermoleophilaceae bacterium]|nr:NAD(P)/FAD-dependent oxidoreductase [Thermoleophilaceae bacterium]